MNRIKLFDIPRTRDLEDINAWKLQRQDMKYDWWAKFDLCLVFQLYQDWNYSEARAMLYKNIKAIIPKSVMTQIQERSVKYLHDNNDCLQEIFIQLDSRIISEIEEGNILGKYNCNQAISFVRRRIYYIIREINKHYWFWDIWRDEHLNMTMYFDMPIFYWWESSDINLKNYSIGKLEEGWNIQIEDDNVNPLEYVDSAFRLDKIRQVFNTLTPEQQKILAMFEWWYSDIDISKSIDKTRQWVHKAKNKILSQIKYNDKVLESTENNTWSIEEV